MKTQQEITEMAEREYLIGGEKTLELLKEGFIKGYQAAQEDMKQTLHQHLKGLTNAIEESHCYGFDDVLSDYIIKNNL